MRRPLAAALAAQCLGILTAYYAPRAALVLWAGAGAALCLYCPAGRRAAAALAAFAFFSAGLFSMYAKERRPSAAAEFAGSVVTVSGTAKGIAVKDGYVAVTLRAEALIVPKTGERAVLRENVLVRADGLDGPQAYDLPGRLVSFTGELSLPDGRRNPGGFDYSLYLKGRGVRTILSASSGRMEAGRVRSGFLHLLSAEKGRFFGAAAPLMDKDAFGVTAGLLFGEKGFIDSSDYEEFRKTGTAHVLAVSGLHTGMLYAVIRKLFAGRRNAASTIVSAAALCCYAALSDFSVSVLRACCMIFLGMAAFHMRRRYDMLSAASLTAVVFTLADPYLVFDSGTRLSFLAAYSLGSALPWMELKLLEISDRLRSELFFSFSRAAAPAAAIYAGMTPLLVYTYMYFSPFTFLTNPAAAFIAGLLLPAGLALFAVWELFGKGILFAAGCGAANGLARSLLALCSRASSLLPSFRCPAPPLGALCCYYLLFFFFFSESRYIFWRKKAYRPLALCFAGLLAAGCALPFLFGETQSPLPWKYNEYAACFLDVGQGDCIHLRSGKTDILIDGGGSLLSNTAEKTLAPYLLKNGVRSVDAAVITHPDTDHSLGIAQLSQIMEIETVFLPEAFKDEDLSGFRCGSAALLSAGDELRAGGISLKVLWPEEGGSYVDANSASLVCLAETKGARILLTGDIPSRVEEKLAAGAFAEYLKADILKAAHHGSAGSTGETFLAACDPAAAVISCGRGNPYGHPAPRVVALLSDSDIIICRTDEDGAICLKGSKDGVMELENASGRKRWHIRREAPNIRTGPFSRR